MWRSLQTLRVAELPLALQRLLFFLLYTAAWFLVAMAFRAWGPGYVDTILRLIGWTLLPEDGPSSALAAAIPNTIRALTFWTVMATAQWLVLRLWFSRMVLWIPATAIAATVTVHIYQAIAALYPEAYQGNIEPITLTAANGLRNLSIAMVQWAILRRRLVGAHWFVLAVVATPILTSLVQSHLATSVLGLINGASPALALALLLGRTRSVPAVAVVAERPALLGGLTLLGMLGSPLAVAAGVLELIARDNFEGLIAILAGIISFPLSLGLRHGKYWAWMLWQMFNYLNTLLALILALAVHPLLLAAGIMPVLLLIYMHRPNVMLFCGAGTARHDGSGSATSVSPNTVTPGTLSVAAGKPVEPMTVALPHGPPNTPGMTEGQTQFVCATCGAEWPTEYCPVCAATIKCQPMKTSSSQSNANPL